MRVRDLKILDSNSLHTASAAGRRCQPFELRLTCTSFLEIKDRRFQIPKFLYLLTSETGQASKTESHSTSGHMSESNDLFVWLSKSGCQQYYNKFVKHGVTVALVPELDTDALREIGVIKVGDRLRLELAISELKLHALKSKISLDEIKKTIQSNTAYTEPKPVLPEPTTFTGGASPLRIVTFILPDGSLKKVNVEGCFNAELIKRKVLKKLGVRQNQNEYDVYVHTSISGDSKITSLYDVEFVTICFSPDRLEKHRLMLTPKNEQPTATALKQSALIFRKTYKVKPTTAEIRRFFGQRPPSELISSNLGEYFPTAELHALEATIRNSVRQSIRLLKKSPFIGSVLNVLLGKPSFTSDDSSPRSSPHQRTIGDVLLHNVNMLDEAKNPSVTDNVLFLSKMPNPATALNISFSESIHLAGSPKSGSSLSKSRFSVATQYTSNNKRHSRIDVLNVDSDDDGKNDFLRDYENSSEEDTDRDNAFKGRKWLQGARIGAGSFGTVYLGMDPLSGELMAVKQVPIPSGNSKENEQARSMITALQREMALLKELHHENIVLYYGLSSESNYLNIFLEYIPGGSVLLMLQLYGPFEEPLIRNFVRQVLVGLSYLHSVDIIHRDIKGANILIDIKGIAKISDFGISKKLETEEGEDSLGGVKQTTGKQAKRASLQGLVYWMAPEVVKQTAYTKKADIWSVGCLIVEMFTGRHPFPNFSQMQAIFKIGTHTRPEVPENCTLEGQDFIRKTFEFDFEKRPSAVDLLTETFLTPLIISREEPPRIDGPDEDSMKSRIKVEESEEEKMTDVAQSTFLGEIVTEVV